MALIDLHNIYKTYGDHVILEGASLQVYAQDKIGLIGDNGAGKTTILKIITGEEKVDEGQIFQAKNMRTGYLSQKPLLLPRMSLKEFLQESLADLYQIKNRLEVLEEEMALPHIQEDENQLNQLMEEYGHLSYIFEARDGYNLEKRLEEVSAGLAFSEADLERPISEFSGGEKTRAQLASLLLKDYDILLLDEPTNNLDMETMQWLENYLATWKGTLIIVSHDRYFLDQIINKTAILEKERIKCYKGNYSSYRKQKDLEELTEEREYEKQQQSLKKEMDFIQNASSQQIRKAQSKQKKLDKMELIDKPTPTKKMKPKFDFAGRGSKIMLSMEEVNKSLDGQQVFQNLNFELYWKEKIAVIGPNGSGKTTLLRLATGEIPPDKGKIRLGPSAKIAYYDQEQKDINLQKTVLENIMDYSPMDEPEARKYLGRYLFTQEDVYREAKDLSSGEKTRLALALTTLYENNFLLMDEPTNFLDIRSMEQLENSLKNYPGSMLIVSHDRFFISRIATGILEIKNGEGNLYRDTSYSEYLQLKEKEKINEDEVNDFSQKEEHKKKNRQKQREKREEEKKKRQEIIELRRNKRKLEQSLHQIETEIEQEEDKKTQLTEKLADPQIYENYDEVRKLTEQLEDCQQKIGELYKQMELTLEEIDNLPEEGVIQSD